MVKDFFKKHAGRTGGTSRHRPVVEQVAAPSLRLVHSKAITPSDDECRANPRARSAKLRVAEKISEVHYAD